MAGGVTNIASVPHVTVCGGMGNLVTDNDGFVGGGAGNRAGDAAGTTSDAINATVSGGFANAAGKTFSTVGGGGYNLANGVQSTIAGGTNNRATALDSTVSGGSFNEAIGGGAAVGGGSTNRATATHATVGGGTANQAIGSNSTVGGGTGNLARAESSTIGGGAGNLVDFDPLLQGRWGTIGGGYQNEVRGIAATVPGGQENKAFGMNSYAAGYRARAQFSGRFVWSDTSSANALTCNVTNAWVARAAGGVRCRSNADATSGVQLTAGASAWASVSDRNAKRGFTPVDPQDVLKRVAKMPISTWTYKAEPGVRHMGPMAQDFRATFGLGTDERTIVTIDADGVMFAAIQGLNQKLELEKGALKKESITLLPKIRNFKKRTESSKP